MNAVYVCYCAYVLRISRYSGFLIWVGAYTNAWIFLRYVEKSELCKCSWCPKRKLGVTIHFSEVIKLHFEKKTLYVALYFTAFLNNHLLRMIR